MIAISNNITYAEAIKSATAKSQGIDNVPNAEQLKNMQYWAKMIFEPTRKSLGDHPIAITSFFRSPKLNQAIGGSATSQHAKGEAGDMDGDVYGFPSNKNIFEYVKDNLLFDQLICEGIIDGQISWVHASIKRTGVNRKEVLFMYHSLNGKTVPSGTPGAKKVYEPFSQTRYQQLVYPNLKAAI